MNTPEEILQSFQSPSLDPWQEAPILEELATSQGFFQSIALPLAKRELKVMPVNKKKAFLPNHHKQATSDIKTITEDWKDYANYNVAVHCIQEEGGAIIVDVDGFDLRGEYKKDTGKEPPVTYVVQSTPPEEGKPGKEHWYMWQTDATRRLPGNITEGSTGHAFSLRLKNFYAVGEGSIHPDHKGRYSALSNARIIPMPDDFLAWLIGRANKASKTGDYKKKAEGWLNEPFIEGNIDNQLVSFAGHYVDAKNISDAEELYTLLAAKIEKNGCFYKDGTSPFACDMARVRQIAEDKVKVWKTGEQKRAENRALTYKDGISAKPELQLDTTATASRPVFPEWVMHGTSVHKGLVKPVIETSSKHAEFLFMATLVFLMNYLYGRVRIEFQDVNMNVFLGLVSPYGKFFKSSSCKLALEYCELAGLADTYTPAMKNADGKTLMMQAGSPEGLGLAMSRINANHAVLYNDELGKFVSKAGIEGSSYAHDLLSFYESDQTGNAIKSKKESYTFKAGEYCFSWLWCTTDRGFNRHWPKLAGISSGLEDRMFFLVSPEQVKTHKAFERVNVTLGAVETRKLIDNAIAQDIYRYEDKETAIKMMEQFEPRAMGMVMKFALFFAIDLGLTEITGDCLERAVALVNYRNQSAKFLAPIEADNEQGRLQKEMIRELQQNKGKMRHRDLCRNLDYTRYGTDRWRGAYIGLTQVGIITEFQETAEPGVGRSIKMVGLLKMED